MSRRVSAGRLPGRLQSAEVAFVVARRERALSLLRARDATPLVPGEPAALTIQLWPMSALARRGHRMRLAIAGADAGTFERLPGEGTPTIRVSRTGSLLELLVID